MGRIPQLVAEARRKLGREDAEVSRIVFSRSRGRRKKPGRVKATVYLDDNGSTKAFALDAQGDRSEERKKRRRKKRRRRKRR